MRIHPDPQVNTVFLHLRKVLRMSGLAIRHPAVQFSKFANYVTYIPVRGAVLFFQAYWCLFDDHKYLPYLLLVQVGPETQKEIDDSKSTVLDRRNCVDRNQRDPTVSHRSRRSTRGRNGETENAVILEKYVENVSNTTFKTPIFAMWL